MPRSNVSRAARVARLLAALVAFAIATAAPASAQGLGCPLPTATGAPLTASLERTGMIDLSVKAPTGSTVTVGECTRETSTPIRSLTATGGQAKFDEAATWACERVHRQFWATIRTPKGVETAALVELDTPLCTHRFSLSAPPTARLGRTATAILTDSWGLGDVRGKFCIKPPSGTKVCSAARLGVARRKTTLRFKASKRGLWTVQFSRAGVVEVSQIAVGRSVKAPPPLPRIVATGDSTMLGVSNYLAEELAGEVQLFERTKPGSGISSAGSPWPGYAASQSRLRAQLVVWSVGAAEGYAMKGVECCGEAWRAEYLRRLERVVEIYRASGAAVLLATPPVPQDPRRAAIFATTTELVLQVAREQPGVSVERIDQLVSPGGYTETIRYGGQEVAIRNPDGVHLNRAGQAIEAHALAGAVRELLAEQAQAEQDGPQ